MKRILSLMAAVLLLLTMAPAVAESGVEYIAAPYAVSADGAITDAYFDPVVYGNEGGMPVSVTTLGVLKVDGLYFKDMDNDRELDDFEDWRLDAAARAAALTALLSDAQKAAYLCVDVCGNPAVTALADVFNTQGRVQMAALTAPEGAAEDVLAAADIIDNGLRHAVYCGGDGFDASVVALMNNAANQLAEHAAVANGTVYLPFSTVAAADSAPAELLAAEGIELLCGDDGLSVALMEGEDLPAVCAAGLNGGADLLGAPADAVLQALNAGLISREALDAAVAARLADAIALGRLDHPYVNPAYADSLRETLTAGE